MPLVLLGLTATTGLVDAVSDVALGPVFHGQHDGDVVLLAFAAGGAQGVSVDRSGAALAAFLAGA